MHTLKRAAPRRNIARHSLGLIAQKPARDQRGKPWRIRRRHAPAHKLGRADPKPVHIARHNRNRQTNPAGQKAHLPQSFARRLPAPNQRSISPPCPISRSSGFTRVWQARETILAQDRLLPVCVPSVAARLNTPQDLLQETLLYDESWQDDWPLWAKAHSLHLPASQDLARYSLYALVLADAKAGFGVLMGHLLLVQAALAKGDLVAPFNLPLRSDEALVLQLGQTVPQDLTSQLMVKRLRSRPFSPSARSLQTSIPPHSPPPSGPSTAPAPPIRPPLHSH